MQRQLTAITEEAGHTELDLDFRTLEELKDKIKKSFDDNTYNFRKLQDKIEHRFAELARDLSFRHSDLSTNMPRSLIDLQSKHYTSIQQELQAIKDSKFPWEE